MILESIKMSKHVFIFKKEKLQKAGELENSNYDYFLSEFEHNQHDNFREAEVAAQKLLARGCQNVLITLGSLGALYLNGQTKKFHHSSIPTVNCVDSTGAGDSFIGALAYLLANSIEPTVEKCIDLSCFVAADSVTRLGTQISFPGPQILDKCPVLSS